MSSSNLRYACGALAALILLVALPTLSHARRSPILHDLDQNSGTAFSSDGAKSPKDNSFTNLQWVTATVSLNRSSRAACDCHCQNRIQ